MHNNFLERKLDKICSYMENNILISSLRHGLSLAIPFFLIGSMALLLLNFPVPAYIEFIHTVWHGNLASIILSLFNATMGVISLILIVAISHSYGQSADPAHIGFYPVTCLVCYLLFVVDFDGDLSLDLFGPNWLFTAMAVTLLCCALLRASLRFSGRWHEKHYHEGIDLDFQGIVISLLPIFLNTLLFVFLKTVIYMIFKSTSLQNIGSDLFMSLFRRIGTGIGGAFLFIFLIHILWFFGIHGSNMLNMVSNEIFEAGLFENTAVVAAGGVPTEIFTKTFFDSFILMGGSGATICLLIAMLIGARGKGKSSSSMSLFKFSIIPSIFNVNELILFGLPVIFNPIMLIPFILVPLILLCTSAGFMAMGLVPLCTSQVQWTTPVLFSGWLSTGSWTGTALQLFNIILGTILYLPFIRLSEKYYSGLLKRNVNSLRDEIMRREETGNTSSLSSAAYQDSHDVIKLLTSDLRYALNYRKISLYYQPQFRCDGTLYGVEALLRWNHPNVGFLYPPMVVELARNDGTLQAMGYQIIETAACALERLSSEIDYPIHMAVNISPVQLEDEDFCKRVRIILDSHDFHGSYLCFEVTEQIALASTPTIQKRMRTLQDMQIPFHMDDFGMGHSSMIYLQNNEFSAIKLDGRLIRDMVSNKKSQEIISSIQRMSESLNYDLIAEYVESEEQQKALDTLGCHIYQGYLYSAALPLPELEAYLAESHVIRQESPDKAPLSAQFL